MTEHDKQAASCLLSSLYLSYERVLRAERTITPTARQSRLQKAKNNILNIVNYPQTKDLRALDVE